MAFITAAFNFKGILISLHDCICQHWVNMSSDTLLRPVNRLGWEITCKIISPLLSEEISCQSDIDIVGVGDTFNHDITLNPQGNT